MSKVHGWLFLDDKKTRLRFVDDSSVSKSEITVDWNRLLDQELLRRFVAKFNATPTREGPLSGWRIDADAEELCTWLQTEGRTEG